MNGPLICWYPNTTLHSITTQKNLNLKVYYVTYISTLPIAGNCTNLTG